MAGVAAGGLAVIGPRLNRRVPRVEVRGDSMLPGLRPGDRLLLVPVNRPRVGQVVAFPDPRQPDRVLIKRVRSVGPEGLEVVGDNPARSTDSRTFGALPLTSVLGRAIYRYAPAGRAGRLRE